LKKYFFIVAGNKVAGLHCMAKNIVSLIKNRIANGVKKLFIFFGKRAAKE
jgi:hypothetical protein